MSGGVCGYDILGINPGFDDGGGANRVSGLRHVTPGKVLTEQQE